MKRWKETTKQTATLCDDLFSFLNNSSTTFIETDHCGYISHEFMFIAASAMTSITCRTWAGGERPHFTYCARKRTLKGNGVSGATWLITVPVWVGGAHVTRYYSSFVWCPVHHILAVCRSLTRASNDINVSGWLCNRPIKKFPYFL